MTKLWRIIGTSKGGNAVCMHVRAADYFEARKKARQARVVVRDIALHSPRQKLEDHLTKNQYRKAIDAIGLSQVGASEFFEVSRKTSPRWARNEAPIPGAVAKLLRVMIKYKISPEEVDKLE